MNDFGVRQSPGNLTGDTNLLASLDDASGMVDSAVLVAGRYTPAQLATLTGQDQAFLIRLTCDLAYVLLVERRGTDAKALPQFDRAMEELKKLREGDHIFNIDVAITTGNITAEFPSTILYQALNLARDYAARMFPIRREQNEK